MSKEGSRPTWSKRDGNVEVAVWRNTDGQGRSHFDTTATRHYQLSGTWKRAASFGEGDLQKLAGLLGEAFSAIQELKVAELADEPRSPLDGQS